VLPRSFEVTLKLLHQRCATSPKQRREAELGVWIGQLRGGVFEYRVRLLRVQSRRVGGSGLSVNTRIPRRCLGGADLALLTRDLLV
jgi:hypothetical protein